MQPGKSLSKNLRSNDVDAFTQFVRTHESALLRIAARITGSIEDAEEVRQQVLLAVWQKPQSIPDDERLTSWLYRCTTNAAIDVLRKRGGARQASLNDDIEQEDRAKDTVDDRELLEPALARLTPQQRVLLSLRFDVQQTVREIAATLKLPHTTVQSQLERALAQLRSLLKEDTAGEHS